MAQVVLGVAAPGDLDGKAGQVLGVPGLQLEAVRGDARNVKHLAAVAWARGWRWKDVVR